MLITHVVRMACLLAVLNVASVAGQQSPSPQVAVQDLRDGLKDPSRWLMYGGDYTNRRYSPLTQLTPENVNRLTPQWTFQGDRPALWRGIATVPLAVDGVLYFAATYNRVLAVDARTGRQIWRYERALPTDLAFPAIACCALTRGVGMLGDQLFLGTLDAHLVSLDMKTGKPIWDTTIDDYHKGYSVTSAPLVIGDKIVVGVAGGDRPNRCFLDAYDAQTGTRVWRFYTVPAPGEPGSETWGNNETTVRAGGATWVTGSYDPELNLVYWGTGNAFGRSDARPGDNLYTGALIALDGDTGKLRWHYQTVPHDIHDYDASAIPVLADLTISGQQRKVVLFAPKVGYLYVLDRTNGKFVEAHALAESAKSWAEIGRDGRPIINPEDGTQCLPDIHGVTQFWPPSYDPVQGLFFVTVHESCTIFNVTRPPGQVAGAPGSWTIGGAGYAALRAMDPATGAVKWEYRYPPSDFGLTGVSQSRPGYGIGSSGGVTSTASGLIFTGDNEGNFITFNSRTGKPVYHYQLGAPVWGTAPMTYMLDGKQHVLVSAGLTLTDFAIPDTPQR